MKIAAFWRCWSKMPTLPPIDFATLRMKAESLLTLAPRNPVMFDHNGVATENKRGAMVTFTLDRDGETVKEHWTREDEKV